MKGALAWRYINESTHLKVEVGICFATIVLLYKLDRLLLKQEEAARIGHSKSMFVHIGLHLNSQAEIEPYYVQYGPLLLYQLYSIFYLQLFVAGEVY